MVGLTCIVIVGLLIISKCFEKCVMIEYQLMREREERVKSEKREEKED